MKKKLILLLAIPSIIVLSSCAISFTDDPGEHSIFEPTSSSSPSSSMQDIEYFDGNEFEDSVYAHKVTIDCTNEYATVGSYYSEAEDILIAMNQDGSESIVNSIGEMQYVGRGDGGLLLGHSLERVNGLLSFDLSGGVLAKAIKINARPRAHEYYESQLGGTKKLRIDEVALSINESKYIKLNNDYTEFSQIEDTVCSVIISETGVSQISISAYNMQAIIHTIDIFY